MVLDRSRPGERAILPRTAACTYSSASALSASSGGATGRSFWGERAILPRATACTYSIASSSSPLASCAAGAVGCPCS
eukprot:3626592-Prymnesium_polylepis.1